MGPFGRVLTAMVTPFTDDGQVNFEQVDRLSRYLVAEGTDALVPVGTTGESPTLSADEKAAVFAAVVSGCWTARASAVSVSAGRSAVVSLAGGVVGPAASPGGWATCAAWASAAASCARRASSSCCLNAASSSS